MATNPNAPTRRDAGITGLIAAVVSLGTGELVSAIVGASSSPLFAVGGRFVDTFAASLKDVAVRIFGTNDKPALIIGTIIVTLAVGALTGALTRRWHPLRWLVFIGFGIFGAWAQVTDPQIDLWQGVVVAIVSVASGLAAFTLLWKRALPQQTTHSPAEDPRVKPTTPTSRRGFIAAAAVASAAGVGFAAAGRALAQGDVVAAVRALAIPVPRRRVPVPDDTSFRVPGMSPYVVKTEDFYRIDTALAAPQVDATQWMLRVDGLVERPFTLSYEELLSLPSVEEVVTLQCVSNEIGGDLVGNAVWQGVPLTTLLDRAGVRPEAEQVFSRSVDGWTCGFPVSALGDDRTAIVAYAMNGERLPVEHGFPARLVVSGLYGYVSATKWLSSIELTTWDGADGYWVPRGWSKQGPIKLTSRVDVPRDGAKISAGAAAIAGVAWRPAVGVAKVDVSIDDGPWQSCELGEVASEHTWVQWRYQWNAEPGDHSIRVRAVDRNGESQIEELAEPAPNGATGLHRVNVTVSP